MCGYGQEKKKKKKKTESFFSSALSNKTSKNKTKNQNDTDKDAEEPNQEGYLTDSNNNINHRDITTNHSLKTKTSVKTKTRQSIARTPPSSESSFDSTKRAGAKTPSSGSSNNSIVINVRSAVLPSPSIPTGAAGKVFPKNSSASSDSSTIQFKSKTNANANANANATTGAGVQIPFSGNNSTSIPNQNQNQSLNPPSRKESQDEPKSETEESNALKKMKKKKKAKVKEEGSSSISSKVSSRSRSRSKSKTKSKSKIEEDQLLDSNENTRKNSRKKTRSKSLSKSTASDESKIKDSNSENEKPYSRKSKKLHRGSHRIYSDEDSFGKPKSKSRSREGGSLYTDSEFSDYSQPWTNPNYDRAIKSRRLINDNIESKKFSMKTRKLKTTPNFETVNETNNNNNNNNYHHTRISPTKSMKTPVIAPALNTPVFTPVKAATKSKKLSKTSLNFNRRVPSPTRESQHVKNERKIKTATPLTETLAKENKNTEDHHFNPHPLIPASLKKKKSPSAINGTKKTSSKSKNKKPKKPVESQEFTIGSPLNTDTFGTVRVYQGLIPVSDDNARQTPFKQNQQTASSNNNNNNNNSDYKVGKVGKKESSLKSSSVSGTSTKLITPGQSSNEGSSDVSVISKTPINPPTGKLNSPKGSRKKVKVGGSRFKFNGYRIKLDWKNAQLRKSIIQLFVNPKASDFHFADRKDSGSVETKVSSFLKIPKKLKTKLKTKRKESIDSKKSKSKSVKSKKITINKEETSSSLLHTQIKNNPKDNFKDSKNTTKSKFKVFPSSKSKLCRDLDSKEDENPKTLRKSEPDLTKVKLKNDLIQKNKKRDNNEMDSFDEDDDSLAEEKEVKKNEKKVKAGQSTKVYQLTEIIPDKPLLKSSKSKTKSKEVKWRSKVKSRSHSEIDSFDLKPSEISADEYEVDDDTDDNYDQVDDDHHENQDETSDSDEIKSKSKKTKSRKKEQNDSDNSESEHEKNYTGPQLLVLPPNPKDIIISKSLAEWKKKQRQKLAEREKDLTSNYKYSHDRPSGKRNKNNTVKELTDSPPDFGLMWAEAIIQAQKKYQEQKNNKNSDNSNKPMSRKKRKRAMRLQRLYSATGKADKFPPLEEDDPNQFRFPKELLGDSSSSDSLNVDNVKDFLNQDPKVLAAAVASIGGRSPHKKSAQQVPSYEVFQPTSKLHDPKGNKGINKPSKSKTKSTKLKQKRKHTSRKPN